MDAKTLFTMALGLQDPWEVVELRLDEPAKTLLLGLDFRRGARFPCPECGASCVVHDTSEGRWRHLNFFEFRTELVARVPRTKCGEHGVKTASVPWARPGSGFTLLFEALLMAMGESGVTMNAMARLVGEHDTRLWRVVHHYVEGARAAADYSAVRHVGVDETSRAKGQRYVTTFVDMEQRRVLFVTEGRDAQTVTEFRKDLEAHGGSAANVAHACLDMSGAFKKGLREEFPNAQQTFDKFHVVKLANDALDEVRRSESKRVGELKGTRYAWLKNAPALTEAERQAVERARRVATKTASAYRVKLRLQEIYKLSKAAAELELVKWFDAAIRAKTAPIKRLGRTVRDHVEGILRWWDSRLTNGLLEGFNSLIQAAKARARGFRSFRNMRTVIYLLLAGLDFKLPDVSGAGRAMATSSAAGMTTHTG